MFLVLVGCLMSLYFFVGALIEHSRYPLSNVLRRVHVSVCPTFWFDNLSIAASALVIFAHCVLLQWLEPTYVII